MGSASSTTRKTPCITSQIAAFCNSIPLNWDSILGVSIADKSWLAADGRKRDIIALTLSSRAGQMEKKRKKEGEGWRCM